MLVEAGEFVLRIHPDEDLRTVDVVAFASQDVQEGVERIVSPWGQLRHRLSDERRIARHDDHHLFGPRNAHEAPHVTRVLLDPLSLRLVAEAGIYFLPRTR